jgi:hypothetical protein
MTQPEEGPISHVLGAGHGATLLAAIDALCRGSVRVKRDEGVRGEAGCGNRDMEATGEMGC